jgi:hypothetical protein
VIRLWWSALKRRHIVVMLRAFRNQKGKPVSDADVKTMVDRALSEPEFRAELSKDPGETAKKHGYNLTDDEIAALASTDWEGSDEQLLARVSKSGACMR